MKKLFLSIIVFMATSSAFAGFGWQAEFTNVQDENLKGNVIAVLYSRYEYKENFGEPVPGKLERMYATFYDENGRSILNRSLFADSGYYSEAQSTLFDYTNDASGITVHRPMITWRGKANEFDLYFSKILSLDNSYEQTMVSNEGCGNYLTIDYKYDANKVLTTYTMLDSNNKIVAKLVAKPTGNGNYEYAIYNASGEATEKGVRTYKNGKLVKVDKPESRFRFSRDIVSFKMGNYTYDPKGRIIQYCQLADNNQDGGIAPFDSQGRKYVYNQQGDEIQWINGSWGWGKDKGKMIWPDPKTIYTEYKYDENGNWISRIDTKENNRKYIETRQIIYCSSKEELQQIAASLRQSAGDIVKSKQK